MHLTLSLETSHRVQHLESLFRLYPDVPFEVIFKEDAQREGFLVTEAALQLGHGKRLKTYHLFSWDQSSLQEVPDKAPVQLPNVIEVEGGPYGLRRTVMRPRLNARSPYMIDVVEEAPAIVDRATSEILARIKPWHRAEPKFFSRTFPDGTPYVDVVRQSGEVIAFRQCQHWGPEEECKFCDINENARTKKLLGQVVSIQPKKLEQVAEVEAEIFLKEHWGSWMDAERPYHIHINGGTITQTLRGLSEEEFYLQYVDAIRARIGGKVPIMLQTAPHSRETESQIYRRGVNGRSSNFEVWDRDLFRIIAPGKDRYMGRDEWIRRMVDQVEVFGVGWVVPGFVAGVEMAQPWGFKSVAEAVRSTTEAMEFFMSHGIVLRPISWCVEALSALAGQRPPPVDYFIQIDRNWYEIWKKYDLPPQQYHPIGPGRNRYPNSGAWDMEG